jgi:phospholipid transport system substrate-binding protein
MIRSFVLAVMMIGLVASPALAEDGPGTKVVKQANATIKSLLKQKATTAKVTTGIRDFIDIDELGKRALVDHWGKLKPAEQKEYLDVLRALIEDNYKRGAAANVNYTVKYTGESTTATGEIVVTTEVKAKRKGRPLTIAIDYVLVKETSGKLKAFDIKTDGVGLVENYRAQFNKIIEKDGIAGLIEKMKKKQAEGAAAAEPAAGAAGAKTGG